jgi:hypothetical protein
MARLDVAELRRQIGVGTLMATGARNWVRDEHSVTFTTGDGRERVTVTLTAQDTYDVRWLRYGHGYSVRPTADRTLEGVYGDQIGEVIDGLVNRRGRSRRRVAAVGRYHTHKSHPYSHPAARRHRRRR